MVSAFNIFKKPLKYSALNKMDSHWKQVNQLIRRKTSWEMRRKFVLAPEMSPTHDVGAVLLVVILLWAVGKRKRFGCSKKQYIKYYSTWCDCRQDCAK